MSRLLVVGDGPLAEACAGLGSAAGHEVAAASPADAVARVASGDLLVVTGAVDGAEDLLARAAAGGAAVLLAPDARLLAALPPDTAGAERAIVACSGRFEPAGAALAGPIAAGTLGLPWGIHAEGLDVPGDPRAAALDLADLLVHLTGCAVVRAERLDRDADPVSLVLDLDHGVLGSVTVARAAADGPCEPRLAVRVDASHGLATTDLVTPALATPAGPRRIGPTGTERLLAAALDGGPSVEALRLPAVVARLGAVITALSQE